MQRTAFLFLLLSLNLFNTSAQDLVKSYKLHSHNDYLQAVPFWTAYANGMESIEADVLFIDDKLFVAHEKESIIPDRTLTSLYLDPIRTAFKLNLGNTKQFQLLIDIKTEPYAALKKLEEVLSQYQDVLTGENYSGKVTVVISGNRPEPNEYTHYPDYIHFDYQNVRDTTALPLRKIALISLNFRKFSAWDGEGKIPEKDLESIKKAIRVAHSLKKAIRFWGTPDSKTSWETLGELGVDYINTDHPFEARSYFRTLDPGKPF